MNPFVPIQACPDQQPRDAGVPIRHRNQRTG
ncbi:MAG: hypothetical protein ACI80K_001586, partial [Paracoccaceae bacterium]